MSKMITDRGVYNIDIPANPKVSSTGEYYIVCPVCDSERMKHKGEKLLSINLNKFPHPWRCKHCGRVGFLSDESTIANMKIKPLLNNFKHYELTDKILNWFWEERKISKASLDYLKIGRSVESLMQRRNNDNKLVGEFVSKECINFKYIVDGILVNIKYRDKDKNFKLLSGASKPFYNLDSIKKSSQCIIVEGEIDVASFVEAGLTHVISVPNGVTITKEEREAYEKTGQMIVNNALNLEYLDICEDKLTHIESFIIATDDDPAGIKLREELARRLGKDKCSYVCFSDYKKADGEPCKDANDVLIHHGPVVLKSTVNSVKSYPIKGVVQAVDYLDMIKSVYIHGEKSGLTTGYKTLDPYFRWMPGWTYVVNGFPQHGKSSFMFNLLALSSVLHDYKWGMYCPENYPPWRIINTLSEILIGNSVNMKIKGRIPLEDLERVIKKHINTHFFFVDGGDDDTGYAPDELRDIKRKMIRLYGINGFYTDPWKNLTHQYKGVNIDEYLREQLNSEVRIGIKNDLINVISHHPPTPIRDKNKEYKAPSPFELIGGQVWYASVYGMICINRQEQTSLFNTNVEIHVQKQKEQKLAGELTERESPVILKFEKRTGRFLEKANPEETESSYIFPINDYYDNKQLTFDTF